MLKNSQVVISLALLQTQILKKIDSQLSVHGISFSEFLVMYHLSSTLNKTMRRIDLAEKVGMSASGVTRLLNPMEKIKLIQKEINPRDARVSLVKLSEAGEKIFSESIVSFEQSSDSIFNALNKKQVGTLFEISQTLL